MITCKRQRSAKNIKHGGGDWSARRIPPTSKWLPEGRGSRFDEHRRWSRSGQTYLDITLAFTLRPHSGSISRERIVRDDLDPDGPFQDGLPDTLRRMRGLNLYVPGVHPVGV